MTPHWAAHLIGKPYRKDAEGPEAFDCLGFTKYVFREYKGVDLPITEIRATNADNESAIREAAKRSGLRPVTDGSHLEDDLMLMENGSGPHIGIVIRTNARLWLLHSVEPVGVCLMELKMLGTMGYRNIRSWRIAS